MNFEDIVLVAVDIRSAFNVGAFFRTCDGFGASLILTGITPHPTLPSDKRLPHISAKMHREIAKTALGAQETVSWAYYDSFFDATTFLKEHQYRIIALEQSTQSIPLDSLVSSNRVAIVVGPEVTGLSEDNLSLCDARYEIPMCGSKESFNVSIAAGIALYQARLLTKQ